MKVNLSYMSGWINFEGISAMRYIFNEDECILYIKMDKPCCDALYIFL